MVAAADSLAVAGGREEWELAWGRPWALVSDP
jgi:hypothetical protein